MEAILTAPWHSQIPIKPCLGCIFWGTLTSLDVDWLARFTRCLDNSKHVRCQGLLPKWAALTEHLTIATWCCHYCVKEVLGDIWIDYVWFIILHSYHAYSFKWSLKVGCPTSVTLKVLKNMCCELYIVLKIFIKHSTIHVVKYPDFTRKEIYLLVHPDKSGKYATGLSGLHLINMLWNVDETRTVAFFLISLYKNSSYCWSRVISWPRALPIRSSFPLLSNFFFLTVVLSFAMNRRAPGIFSSVHKQSSPLD